MAIAMLIFFELYSYDNDEAKRLVRIKVHISRR